MSIEDQSSQAPDALANDDPIVRVSVDSDGIQGNGSSQVPSISGDGRYVTFVSYANNLVPGDTNGAWDVFVHDRQTGETTRVSVDSDGIQGNDSSYVPSISISGDGRSVTFYSEADNLVPGDTNGTVDVFVHDRQTGETTRVSVDSDGIQGNSWSNSPSISGDGRYVTFYSPADNLVPGDTNGAGDVFVHDRQTGETTRVSVDSDGNQGNDSSWSPSISGDGRYVTFSSEADNVVPGDTNGRTDVFVHDRQSGETTRASVDSDGNQGNGRSVDPSISGDGGYVTFDSRADNLVPGDTNGARDIYVHDRQSGETTRVSVDSDGNQGNGYSGEPSISGEGRYVTFLSDDGNLVPGDTNTSYDVFVHDRQTGETTRVSVDGDGNQGNGSSGSPSISGDGRYVAFGSDADNLVPGDTNGAGDAFVRNMFLPTPQIILGTEAKDTLTGTPAREVIAGLGGGDGIMALAGDDVVFGDCAAEAKFVSEDAGYRNTIGLYDPVTGAATIVLPDASDGVADGYDAWLCAPCGVEWFLIPNGATHNPGLKAGGGYDVAEIDGRWQVLDAEGTALAASFQDRVEPGAYFSQAERNPDNQTEHVKALADGAMGWEDLWNGGDADFNDVILDVALYGEGPAGDDLLIGGAGDDILCGGAGSDGLCGDGQHLAFVSEDAGYESILAYADRETDAATVVLANTADTAAADFAADLCLPEDALWCLIPNGHRLNPDADAGAGYRLAGDGETGYHIETADGVALKATIQGQTTVGAFFSDATMNADQGVHVDIGDDGTMAWEDLWIDDADLDFNDVVVQLTENEGADTFVIGKGGASDADTIRDFEPGIDTIELTAFGFDTFDDVAALSVQDGSDVVIDLTGENGPEVTLEDVTLSDLASEHFLL